MEYEIFVVYVISFNSTPRTNSNIYLSHKLKIVDLIIEKAFTKIYVNYANFVDVFSLDLAFKLCKYTRINNYAIIT